jgi:hypothetical protein
MFFSGNKTYGEEAMNILQIVMILLEYYDKYQSFSRSFAYLSAHQRGMSCHHLYKQSLSCQLTPHNINQSTTAIIYISNRSHVLFWECQSTPHTINQSQTAITSIIFVCFRCFRTLLDGFQTNQTYHSTPLNFLYFMVPKDAF